MECQVPEEGVDEVRMHMARRNSVLDGSNDDSSEGEHHKRDEYAFDGISDETESLLGVYCAAKVNIGFYDTHIFLLTSKLDCQSRHVQDKESDVQEVEERLDMGQELRTPGIKRLI